MAHMLGKTFGGKPVRFEVGHGVQIPFVNQYVVTLQLVDAAGKRRAGWRIFLAGLFLLLANGILGGGKTYRRRQDSENGKYCEPGWLKFHRTTMTSLLCS